jgi:pimeloyl-ACP methyl ester carboxylesterase
MRRQRTVLQKIRYVYARAGATLLVLMPVAMWLMFRPWNLPPGTLATDAAIAVRDRADAIVFTPARAAATGLMLLPGCPVDPHAYAPLARRIAEAGHPAVVVRVPYRCASFGDLEQQLDRRVLSLVAASAGTRWVLAGHSRGAVHAARLAGRTPEAFAGLVLMGTSHPRDRDLSALTLPVMKIAGTEDGVAGDAQFESRRLPPRTTWIRIEGGNHAQFAYYAPYQLFDHRARITRAVQQEQVAAALVGMLAGLR